VSAIALVDSLNPTTVGPALFLATTKNARRSVASFTGGVFGVSLIAGLILTFGPGQALMDAVPHPGKKLEHTIELICGITALVIALVLWILRRRLSGHVQEKSQQVERSSLLLGAGIMLVELPTAFPYFAAIAAILSEDLSALHELALILLFNVLFVAPLLLILAARAFLGERGVARLDRVRAGMHAHMGVLIPAVVLVVALLLIGLGGVGLAQG
jgi:cytochrome c biogenesis protein CcdA